MVDQSSGQAMITSLIDLVGKVLIMMMWMVLAAIAVYVLILIVKGG